MYILIDNYDSFTYNLFHFLGELGADVTVYRNDAITASEVVALAPDGVVISPGPCDPDKAGVSLDVVNAAAENRIPLLGVCLGHQALGQAMGGTVVRAPEPMHGKVSDIRHDGTGVFANLPTPFKATRYHSLAVDRASLPNTLSVTAETNDGVVMGVVHTELPLHGVQFHPESIASENGHSLLGNFLKLAGKTKH